jgi:hypothetical protein
MKHYSALSIKKRHPILFEKYIRGRWAWMYNGWINLKTQKWKGHLYLS